ncbi:MAG: hypothetical protein ACD_9C00301G0004 [uncultured bacterium]|nr:MAG: hypothetical protein ACD_9C00301G0004 [uncultured bacterium]
MLEKITVNQKEAAEKIADTGEYQEKNKLQQNFIENEIGDFSSENAREHVEEIKRIFSEHFSSLGYLEHPSVAISSGIDPTVRFIGSHISVFKPYILEKSVPNPGYFMSQDCIRARNLKHLLDDNFLPKWGSYFPSLGTISPPDHLHKVCEEVFALFADKLKIKDDDIRILINSSDTDLLDAIPERFNRNHLEIDTHEEKYYRHKFGIDGVWGRNFNIAIRDKGTDKFSDVANIIMIETEDEKLGIEFALGATTTLKQLYVLDHVADCHPVPTISTLEHELKYKFEDAVIVSTMLTKEGLQPLSTNNRGRILRSYMRSLSYFRAKAGMSIEELQIALLKFEDQQFPDTEKMSAKEIINYVIYYEKELTDKKYTTYEDKTILEAIGNMNK